MKAAGRPISAALRGRRFVAQAATQADSKLYLPKQDVEVSRVPNGAVAVSIENYSPVSRIALFYNAGSKFESESNGGIVHCLRNASDLSTTLASGFGITRSLQQLGANMSCSATRDHLIYSLDCLRSNTEESLNYLRAAATSPAFKPWELERAVPRAELDLALLEQQPQTQMIEALHKAAFRTGLGNSLYMSDFQMGSHTPEMLRLFVQQYFTTHNCAVVGVGVAHKDVVNFARQLPLQVGSAPAPKKSQYAGGEIRIDSNSPLVHAACVTEGVGVSSKDLITLAVLQQVMGPSNPIKYGSNSTSSKAMIAASKGTSKPFLASCLSASYADSGLFGFQVVGQAEDMGSIMRSVAEAFGNATKEGGITDADVTKAKYRVRAASQMEYEDSDLALEGLGVQALLVGEILSPKEVDAAINSITTADVQALAKKVINGKPSMAAIGNLHNTPYMDQLV